VKDSFQQQLDQWKVKYDALQQEKNDIEMEHNNKHKDAEGKNKKKLQEQENKYQQQIVEEVERYQQLLKSKEELQAQYQNVRKLIGDLTVLEHQRASKEA
jgi:hypothetical protein